MSGKIKNFRATANNPEADHSFVDMPKERFEHLTMALHESQPEIRFAGLYAPDGRKQFGVDHLAYRADGTKEAGQAKRYKRVRASDIRKWSDEFLDHWEGHWKDRGIALFRFFFASPVKNRQAEDELDAQRERFARYGVELEWWDANDIFRRLPGAKQVVRQYLGEEGYRQIFGPVKGPFSTLTAQMDAGSANAFAVSAIAREFHTSSAAELESLRRDIRRGRRSEVADRIRAKLRANEVSAALAKDDLAAHLRLLASVEIGEDGFDEAKRLLDQADQEAPGGGASARLRAVLALESEGPEAALARPRGEHDDELAEVRAVARLRQGRAEDAMGELDAVSTPSGREAEHGRLRAVCLLLLGRRDEAATTADAAVVLEPENRACRFVSGVCRFHLALSAAVSPTADSWPRPVEPPLVASTRDAETSLHTASETFASLAGEDCDARDADMRCWQLATLLLAPDRRSEAQELVDDLAARGLLSAGVVAWSMASAIELDSAVATKVLEQELVRNPDDLTTGLVLIAMLEHRRKRKMAREVLERLRSALRASGAKSALVYWDAVLGSGGSDEGGAVEKPVSLGARFRSLHRGRATKARLDGLVALLNDVLAAGDDPGLVLAIVQILHENGRDEEASSAARHLVDGIATAEAIGLAASVLAQAGRSACALEALSHTEAFRDGELPVGLVRLRADLLTERGDIVEARRQNVLLARQTKEPHDVLRAIRSDLHVGETQHALDLFIEHRSRLSRPSPEHVLLARAISRSEPDLAARITREMADTVPDELLPAVFDLTHKLRIEDKQEALLKRMVATAGQPNALVQKFDVGDLPGFIEQQRRHAETINEEYALGRLPVQGAASLHRGGLATTHLASLLGDATLRDARPIFARYGRRYGGVEQWGGIDGLSIVVDLTSLLAAEALDILDLVAERAHRFSISPLTVPALLGMRDVLQTVQPERVEAARSVLSSIGEGAASVSASREGCARITWDTEEAGVSIADVVASASETWGEQRRANAFGKLGVAEPIDPRPVEPSDLTCDFAMATSLAMAGIWQAVTDRFEMFLHAEDAAVLEAALAREVAEDRAVERLDILIAKTRRGLSTGTWSTTSSDTGPTASQEHRCLMDVLGEASGTDTVCWVDDRCVTSIRHDELRVTSSVEMIDLLEDSGAIDAATRRALRARLRRAGWLFIPLDESDLAYPLAQSAVQDDHDAELLDTARRATAFHLAQRHRLQWPRPEQIDAGVQGEVPYLLDLGHGTSSTLARIWSDEDLDEENAWASSDWVIENSDVSLFPMSVLGPDDPRSDFTLGTTLGSLALLVMQISHRSGTTDRQKSYSRWLWSSVLRETLRTRPEAFPHALEFIAKHLVGTLEERDQPIVELDVWRSFVARAFNNLPRILRGRLMERDDVRGAFGLDQSGELVVAGKTFEERPFWTSVLGAREGRQEVQDTEGARWSVSYDEGGDAPAIVLSSQEASYRLPPWPLQMVSDDPEIWSKARTEIVREHDLSTNQAGFLLRRTSSEKPVEVVEEIMRKTSATLRNWYDQFADSVEQNEGLDLDELLPDTLGSLTRRLRIEDGEDLEVAARKLVDEQGVTVAVSRMAALPCPMPEALVETIVALDAQALERFLREFDNSSPMPWSRLRVCETLLRRADRLEHVERFEAAVENAIADHILPTWLLRLGLARMMVADGPLVADWIETDLRGRLAAAWIHADELTRILTRRGPPSRILIDTLMGKLGTSPRHMLDGDGIGLASDAAEPRGFGIERLIAVETGGVLAETQSLPQLGEWAIDVLERTRPRTIDDGRFPSLETTRNALAREDTLGSLFSAQPHERLRSIGEAFDLTSADGASSMLRDLLEKCDADDPSDVDAMIGVAATTTATHPLPDDLARPIHDLFANREVHLEVVLKGRPELGRGVLSTMVAAASLASANDWEDLIPYMECAMDEILERPELFESKDLVLLVDVGFWLYRALPDPFDRLTAMATLIKRLSEIDGLNEAMIQLAKNFARKLCGAQSSPFLDVIGKCGTS